MITIFALVYFQKISQKIPGIMIGIILDSLFVYAIYDSIKYHLNYF
jgi:hypothetical protein